MTAAGADDEKAMLLHFHMVMWHITAPIHDDCSLLNDAISPYHDRTRNGKDGRFWVYDGPCPKRSVVINARSAETVIPDPMVMSPLSSTS
jgi:hypothetical protein